MFADITTKRRPRARLLDLSALQHIRLSGQQMTIRERLPGELIIGVRSGGATQLARRSGGCPGLPVI